MNLRIKRFTCNGEEYEVRAARLENGWEAAVFFNGKKISFDYCEPSNASSVELLVSALELDVQRGNIARW